MGISLFGIKNAENNKPKVHCKCRFDVKSISINPIEDLLNKNTVSGYIFSFKLDFKKGSIAYTTIEINFLEEKGLSKKNILHPAYNKVSETYFCTYLFPKIPKSDYKLSELVVKIVNLCNDATVFKSIMSEELIIKNEREILVEKQGKFVYL